MSSVDFGSNFFGRKAVLDLFKKRLLGLKEGYRQNIALLGDRFVGKSTIIDKFVSDLDDNQVIKIYVDLDNRDLKYLCSKFIGSILYNYAKSEKNLLVYDDINLLIESTKKYIPKTIKEITKIQNDLHHGKRNEAYRSLINLPEVFTNETNKFCLIILDEFHNIDELAITGAFQELGKKIMTQKRSLYVVTSSLPELAKRILAEKLSLLFGNFEVVMINPFDLKTSQSFIQSNLGVLKMGLTLRNFLTDFTGGHPLYLNLIVEELVDLSATHKQADIFSPLLVKSIENTIFDRWGVLSRHFELMINNLCSAKGNQVIASILIALANQKLKIKELGKKLEVKQSPLSQKVNRLIENGIIEKNGNYLYLKDKLLRYWIKYVFQRRLNAIDLTQDKLSRMFRREVNQSIDDFKINARKGLSLRITELLNCFENEAFHINGRRYKLPVFDNIQTVKLNYLTSKNFDILRATAREGAWYIILKRESICESDIHSFVTESRKLVEKPIKRIIVSLSDLDQNAKLKALQERVWIWSEAEINELLNLYDKPYIV